MPTVNIYIETNITGIKPKDGQVIMILEFVASNGKRATNTLKKQVQAQTGKQAVLEAVNAAFRRLKKPCDVTLYLPERYVYESIHQERVGKWESSGWKTARGEEIAYKELWLEYHKVSLMHHVHAVYDMNHMYRAWMKAQI